MKSHKIISFSVAFLLVFSSSLNVFGNSIATFISANSYGKIDISNTTIISSNESGEVISKLSDVSSLYQLSVSERNTYTTGQYAKIISDNSEKTIVPVYSEPKNPGNVIGQVPVGATILINGTEGNFARILYNDDIGYIENKYTKTTGVVEKEEAISEPTKIEQNKPQVQTKYAKVTAETGLNFRELPTTSSKVLRQLPYDTYTILLEIQQGWLKVKTTDGQTGYISADYAFITDKIENQEIISNATAQNVIDFAKQHLGKPYVYGSINLNTGTDCSGFTYSIFKHFGININRTSRDQYLNGTSVDKNALLPGDLVFFNTGGDSTISHVGIYIGNSQYIHCTDSKNQGVIISRLDSDYGLKTYYGARRVLK